uniref:Uroporphyrinogen-III synthase n=1 Tax=Lactuca sativa TaxID=4236 RepID=A0A9R1VJX8_LACSA|nr:hypothetical protein LSAT_V11C500280580 [Lactuca sativa]
MFLLVLAPPTSSLRPALPRRPTLSGDNHPVEPLLSGNLTSPALASNIRANDLRLTVSIAQIYKPYVLLSTGKLSWQEEPLHFGGVVKRVRLYDASANVLREEFLHGGAVLDCCFHDDTSGFSASADNTVTRASDYRELVQNFEVLGPTWWRCTGAINVLDSNCNRTCSIGCFWTGYALSSVEGRVAMEGRRNICSQFQRKKREARKLQAQVRRRNQGQGVLQGTRFEMKITLQFKVTSPEAALVFLQAWNYSHVIYNHRAAWTPNVKVAAFGTGTTIFHEATPSSEQFIEVAFTPSKATGKVLASEPPKQGNERCTHGFHITRLNTYTTEPVQHMDQTILQQALSASVVAVASPSAVGAWVDLLPEPHTWEGSVACIGETTDSAARKLGLTNVYHPSTPGLHDLKYLFLCKNLRVDAYDH